jgi:HEAT repeat protein
MIDFVDGMDKVDPKDCVRSAPCPPRPQSSPRPPALTIVLSLALLPIFGCGQATRSPRPVAKSESASSPTSTPAPPVSGDSLTQARQILLDSLDDADPQIRANAVEVVASIREIRLMPKIQKLLADPIVPVRFAAILAAGDLGFPQAKNDVAPLLNDANPNIKLAASYAMFRLGQPQYYKDLSTAVASSDQTVRANAAMLLGKSGQKDAIRFLYWTLRREDSSDMVVLQAAEAIAMLGDQRIYRKLWTGLISAYADDRVISVRAMGALGTDEAKNAIITMLDDPVPEVRLAAAEQLGKLGDSGGEAEVLAVFEKNLTANMDASGQQRVKTLAALAIGEIGTERPARYLPQLLQDPSKAVRLAAAKAVLRRSLKKVGA